MAMKTGALLRAKLLAKSIDFARLAREGVINARPKVALRIAPRAVTQMGTEHEERALRRFARDWASQRAWARVVDHVQEWDGQQRLVNPAKVFTIRKKK